MLYDGGWGFWFSERDTRFQGGPHPVCPDRLPYIGVEWRSHQGTSSNATADQLNRLGEGISLAAAQVVSYSLRAYQSRGLSASQGLYAVTRESHKIRSTQCFGEVIHALIILVGVECQEPAA